MKKLEQGKTRNSLFGKVYISAGGDFTDYKNKNYGARPLRRDIQSQGEVVLADALLNADIQAGQEITFFAGEDKLEFRV